ncbi:prefoldin subunit alpha [archaeon]|nr:prefoldin subunit alpha [archaeon]
MKEQAQQKYIEVQVLEQQLKQNQKNLEIMHQQMLELNAISESLVELKKTKKGQEMLVPLGSGIFVKSELKDNNEILTNVGSDVVISKTSAEAKTFIKKQTEFVTGMISKTEQEMQSSVVKYQELKEELQGMVEK